MFIFQVNCVYNILLIVRSIMCTKFCLWFRSTAIFCLWFRSTIISFLWFRSTIRLYNISFMVQVRHHNVYNISCLKVQVNHAQRVEMHACPFWCTCMYMHIQTHTHTYIHTCTLHVLKTPECTFVLARACYSHMHPSSHTCIPLVRFSPVYRSSNMVF